MTRTLTMTRSFGTGMLGTARYRRRPGEALRRLWIELVTLPERGRAAPELPPEFFRFPPY
jgi:hypothetical protein